MASKEYVLKGAPASITDGRQRVGIFNRKLAAAKRRCPDLNAHRLTATVLGRFQAYRHLSEADFWMLVRALEQVALAGHYSASVPSTGKGAHTVRPLAPAGQPPAKGVADSDSLAAAPPSGAGSAPAALPVPLATGALAVAPTSAQDARPLSSPSPPRLAPLGSIAEHCRPSGAVDEDATYTANELAAALNVSKRAVLLRLVDAPAQVRWVGGNQANAWPLAALPTEWLATLEALRERGGWRSLHHLLARTESPWEASLPLRECAPEAVEKAMKLRTAQAAALARRNAVSGPELLALGLADYQRTYGHPITPQHWWGLLHRTLERAGAREEFQRIELYLDERPARKVAAKPCAATEAAHLHRLTGAVSLCANPAEPTDAERQTLWEAACATLAAELELGEPPHRVRRSVLDWLGQHAPGLAASEAALQAALHRKFARWRAAGFNAAALKDKRADANRTRAFAVSQADLDTLISRAVFVCDGRVSQAVRECFEQRLVSEELLARYLHNPARKSYLPTKLRELVKHEVAMLRDVHHGPAKTRDNGAYLDRCWDAVAALDWWCADDCTLPVYFYVPDAKAKGGFALLRGQFLLLIDTRSTAILGYALMPERNYNARVIRTLITRAADGYGLPRQGFYFERGIWKDAKILTGDKGEAALDWPEAEQGLREFGLRFMHAIRARSKPVERVLGALQCYTESEPGYCGRDERRDGFESFARLKLELESGRTSPEGRLYSLDQWDARLGELCARYNAEPQAGKHTGGLSPEAALRKFQRAGDPLVKFDASCRYLLAHHKRPLRVTVNGLTLRFGKQVFNYRNARTGALRGQMVLAWFNPDAPEVLTVTDLDRRNAFCIERSQSVPALDAPEELLAQEMGRIAEHMGYATTRYRILKPQFDLAFRANVVSPRVERLGATIAQQAEAIAAERREEASLHRRVRNQSKRLGIPVPAAFQITPEMDEGTRLMLAADEAARHSTEALP